MDRQCFVVAAAYGVTGPGLSDAAFLLCVSADGHSSAYHAVTGGLPAPPCACCRCSARVQGHVSTGEGELLARSIWRRRQCC